MKKYINLILTALVAFGLLSACDESMDKPTIDLSGESFVTPELANAATGNGVLSFETEGDVFEVLSWSNAEYGQNVAVTYTLELDAAEDFSSAIKFVQTEETTASPTVKQVNDAALLLGLAPFESGNLYFRVISEIIGVKETDIISAEITRTVTPYVTDFASIYMIGAALKGWDTSLAVETYGVGPGEYAVVAEFHNGEAFRFFEAADWGATSYNWTYFEGGSIDPNFESAMDGDTNIRFIGTTGYYKIAMDLNDKTITMTALTGKPTLYMVGAAVPDAGWGWGSPIDMTWVQDGVFEATTQLLNEEGASFRFFTGFDDWGSGLNYPHYVTEGYEIDAKFEDALDGDNNFKFVGTTGSYKITVNDIAKTIVISEAGTAGPPKYLVGAGVPDAGWGWTSPIELIQVQVGVFEASGVSFANDAFRVFAAYDDWGSGTNYPGYISAGYTVDANFEDAMDGDNNFKFIGTPGTYKFVLNENTKTITLE